MHSENNLMSAAAVQMPRIIYGTAWKKQATAELVELALRTGFRGIDTACQPKHYNERGVGDGIAAAMQRGLLTRDQLYLQTKFTPLNGQDPQNIPYDQQADLAEQVRQSFDVSLNNLQTAYLDGLVLHSPLADRQQLMQVWQAMEKLVQAGHVRQLGISNCYDPALFEFLYDAATIKPALIQNRFYADTGYDVALRAFCKQHAVIYQSFWTLTANPAVLADTVLKNLAVQYRRTPAQLLFRYLTQQDMIPLTGTRSISHMQQDLAIFEFHLTESECQQIRCLLE
jgi:diketogulonate reductase-like aldo/keto reductase